MIMPQYSTPKIWAASLIIDFPTDNVPILNNEKEWRLWGDILVQSNSFTTNGCPFPKSYSNFNDWSSAVYRTMVDFS
jgi:hypothetical protein